MIGSEIRTLDFDVFDVLRPMKHEKVVSALASSVCLPIGAYIITFLNTGQSILLGGRILSTTLDNNYFLQLLFI